MVPSRHSSLLSPTPSVDSHAMATVPSTIPISVVTSSPVPTLSVQLPQAPLIGSPRALPFKLDVREDDPFALEMRTTSRLTTATVASVNAATLTTETMSREPSKQHSEAPIPLAA